jgi:hypothetical protein
MLNTSLGGGDVKVKSRSFGWTGRMVNMGTQEGRWNSRGEICRKRLILKRRMRWDDTTEVNLKEVYYEDRKWINLALDSVLVSAMLKYLVLLTT